jgi:hypothetical protein
MLKGCIFCQLLLRRFGWLWICGVNTFWCHIPRHMMAESFYIKLFINYFYLDCAIMATFMSGRIYLELPSDRTSDSNLKLKSDSGVLNMSLIQLISFKNNSGIARAHESGSIVLYFLFPLKLNQFLLRAIVSLIED